MMNNEKELYNKLKERIAISNFDDELQNKSYQFNKERSGYSMKRRILQSVASLAIIFTFGLTVYAGVSGNLNLEKLGLLKLSKNYDESATQINQSIENEYCKITLNSMAGDSAYIVSEYTIDFKEAAPNSFKQIDYDGRYGYDLVVDGNVLINSKTPESVMEYVDKITDTEYQYIQVINVMSVKDENIKLEMNFDGLCKVDLTEKDREIKINKKLQADIQIKRTDTEKFEPIKQKLDDKTQIVIEEIANTKFENFIRIKQENQDITWKEYNSNPLEYNSFLITDSKDETLPYTVYSGDVFGKKIYVKQNGKYTQVEDEYSLKDSDIVKIEENYTILLGLEEDVNTIKISPTKTRFYNDRTDEEEEVYNKTTWYPITAGDKKYTQTSSLGGTLEINNIEIDDKNVTFYYDKKGKIGNELLVIVRKNNGIINYAYPTEEIEKGITGNENKITFARHEKYRSGLKGFKMYDDEFDNMLEDIDKAEFTLLYGCVTEIIGKTVELKIPTQNEENAVIKNVNIIDIEEAEKKSNLLVDENTNVQEDKLYNQTNDVVENVKNNTVSTSEGKANLTQSEF